MIPNPLHPAVVHFPIVLAVFLPLAALLGVVLIARGSNARMSWALPAVLGVLLALASFTSVRTGEAQEDRVEAIVDRGPIHEHEEAAEQFLLLTAVLAGVGLVGFARGNVGTAARYLATGGALVVLLAGYQVGRSGGELVYEHGAANAYVADEADGDDAVGDDGSLDGVTAYLPESDDDDD